MKNVLRYLICHADMGGEGGAGAGGSGDAGGQDGGDANQGGDNNANDNLISHDTLWQPDNDGGDAGAGDASANANAGQQVDPNEAFQNHIASLDFRGEIDLNAGLEAVRNGDLEAFGTLINQIGANAYRNAMVDANKVVQQQVGKMGEQVQSNVSASQATSELVREMGTQLPFTKSPAFAPVAKLVLTQFLDKGAAPTDAIANVGKYFQGLAGEVGKISSTPPGRRPSGGFSGDTGNAGDGNDGGEPDWFKILGGAPET